MTMKSKLPAKSKLTTAKKAPSVVTNNSSAMKTKVTPKSTKTVPAVVKKGTLTKQSIVTKVAQASPVVPLKNDKSVKAKAKAVVTFTPVLPSDKAAKGEKKKKQKMVRDSFNMPESDYAYIAALKKRCLKAGTSVKKSELLRAALKCLSNLSDEALTKKISDLEPIKTGRPAKR